MTRAGSAGWGVLTTSFVAALTFGVLPALVWPERFRKLVGAETARLQQALAWARGRGISPVELNALDRAARRIEPRAILSIAPVACAAFVAVSFGLELKGMPGAWDYVVDRTYQFAAFSRELAQSQDWAEGPRIFQLQKELASAVSLHKIWCVWLSVAYLAHWLQVRVHRAQVRRFVDRFNRIIESRGMMPVRMREGFWLAQPLTIVAAIVFVRFGAWWGIPMLLAGTAQSRYILTTSRALQVQLADRMSRDLPAGNFARRCQTDGCRAVLPLPAKFCPQCGSAVAAGGFNAVG